MRQLLPSTSDVIDVEALYVTADRAAPAERPWVIVNMIASADGATSVGGLSGPLGGPADKVVFTAVRGAADWILVGAGTARAENYGPVRPSASTRDRRVSRGQAPAPRVAVVTSSGDLDPLSRLFAESDAASRPLIFTGTACPADRRRSLDAIADVVDVGNAAHDRVDLAAALSVLRGYGAGVVVCEGGPSLNGQLIEAGLVDEWCLTLSPTLAGGSSSRPAVGAEPRAGAARLRLVHLLEDDGLCFTRYVRV
ncbi:MAG: pyrimidine reductase family protein [Acidimicrobiales bacterium]